jgi:hypothetical protein
MKINLPWATILLIFRPSRLNSLAVRYNDWLNTPDAIAERQRRNAETPFYSQSISRIRRGLLFSFLFVFGASALAAILSRLLLHLWGQFSNTTLEFLQYLGIGIILWATLAKQGWSIQTFNGTTVPERLDEVIYRWLYVVGSFLLAFAISMQFGA